MSYAVKEIFLTLQGEGGQAGRPAVFCRFAGCNLWSGLERDREKAVCTFCDTDFVGMDGPGGGRFADAEALAAAVEAAWTGGPHDRLTVLTGGEPLLQVDEALVAALHARGFSIALETNGTRPAPAGIDWVCVSPKADAPVVQTTRRGPPCPPRHRDATRSARASAEANLPPSGPTPTKSVSQNEQIAAARSCSRPLHRLQPANRTNTARRPACTPSPWSVRNISLTA